MDIDFKKLAPWNWFKNEQQEQQTAWRQEQLFEQITNGHWSSPQCAQPNLRAPADPSSRSEHRRPGTKQLRTASTARLHTQPRQPRYGGRAEGAAQG